MMDLGGTHFSVKSNEQSRRLKFHEKDFNKVGKVPSLTGLPYVRPHVFYCRSFCGGNTGSRPPRYAGQSPLVAIDHPNVHASQAHAACKA